MCQSQTAYSRRCAQHATAESLSCWWFSVLSATLPTAAGGGNVGYNTRYHGIRLLPTRSGYFAAVLLVTLNLGAV
jgi:hypothetical protein